jgi:hypothetical protein
MDQEKQTILIPWRNAKGIARKRIGGRENHRGQNQFYTCLAKQSGDLIKNRLNRCAK